MNIEQIEQAASDCLAELASVDTYDVNLCDHPKAWEAIERFAALVRAQALEEAAAELDHDWPADTIEERTMRKQYAKLIRALKASPDAGEPKPLP